MGDPKTPVTSAVNKLIIVNVVMFALLALLGLVVWWDATNKREAINKSAVQAALLADQTADLATQTASLAYQTAKSQCLFKKSEKSRVESASQFLKDNPHGAGGISRSVILVSIRNGKRTLHALKGTKCPPKKPTP